MPTSRLDEATFAALLDELIPARDESLPGAGGLGLGPVIEAKLGDALEAIAGGLAALDAHAIELGANSFVDLRPEDRAALVTEVGAATPGFIESLVFHTYSTYYQDPKVTAAIGLRPGPPYPEGFPLEVGDLDRLNQVRERGKAYRDV